MGTLRKLTCSHILHDRYAKVLVQHGVQASHSASKQLPHFRVWRVHAKVHTVGDAQLLRHELLCKIM